MQFSAPWLDEPYSVPWWPGVPWKKGWLNLPYYFEHPSDLEGRPGIDTVPPTITALSKDRHGLEFESEAASVAYPFEKIAAVITRANVAFANLETPLAARGRRAGLMFRAPGSFADALIEAGFDVISTANNHALDAGEIGLLETIEHLRRAGVKSIGTGANLDEARQPALVEHNGLTIGFLAYTQFEASGTRAFALSDRSGVMPLDPRLVEEDIERLRQRVDFIVLSFHWGFEDTQDVYPVARSFARRMIDAGADIILGHHPHVPRGIEVYRGKVIVYSLGNLVFGLSWPAWIDNVLARFTLSANGIEQVEILPVAGRGEDVAQPYLLTGPRAVDLLKDLRDRSAALNTAMEILGDRGVIVPATATLSADESDPRLIPMIPVLISLTALTVIAGIAGIFVLRLVRRGFSWKR